MTRLYTSPADKVTRDNFHEFLTYLFREIDMNAPHQGENTYRQAWRQWVQHREICVQFSPPERAIPWEADFAIKPFLRRFKN
jgi:hypothetical protein